MKRKTSKLVSDTLSSGIMLGVGSRVASNASVPAPINRNVQSSFGLASFALPIRSAGYLTEQMEVLSMKKGKRKKK